MMWLLGQLWWALLIAMVLGFGVTWWHLVEGVNQKLPLAGNAKAAGAKADPVDVRDATVAQGSRKKRKVAAATAVAATAAVATTKGKGAAAADSEKSTGSKKTSAKSKAKPGKKTPKPKSASTPKTKPTPKVGEAIPETKVIDTTADEKVSVGSVPQQLNRAANADTAGVDVVAEPTPTAVNRFGPGAAFPPLEGGAPEGYEIKADIDTRRYYTKHNREYDRIIASLWFKTEHHALEAGFHPDIDGLA